MGKNVLVISTSLRKGGNSDRIADEFMNGAKDAGNQVEKIELRGKTIAFCKGCLTCQKTQKCVINDDAVWIAEKMKQADVIAFATPIYYYEMSGQMKTVLDRANPLYSSNYSFRDIYFISAAAEDEEGVDSRAIEGLKGWIDCFEKATLAGSIFGGGVNDIGDIEGHQSLKEAYEMGKNV